MKEIVKKIILKLYPELDAGLLTPKFAVVTSIPDAPEEDCVSDQYREYIAVNVRLLDHHMRIDENIEEVKTVPVGGQISGHYRGTLQIPAPGNIVEIAYAYGKMTMPFIRTVLPYHMTLWPAESDATVIQHNINSFQSCDRACNWTRETDSDIIDSSNNNITKAINKLEYLTNEIKEIQGYSLEKTTGIKRIIAGALKFITTGSAHIGATFNLNLTSGKDTNINTAGNRNDNVLGTRKIRTKGSVSDSTEADREIISKTNSLNKAGSNNEIIGKKVWLGSESLNSLNIVLEFMTSVISVLGIIASHNHPLVDTCSQKGEIMQKAQEVAAEKIELTSISKK